MGFSGLSGLAALGQACPAGYVRYNDPVYGAECITRLQRTQLAKTAALQKLQCKSYYGGTMYSGQCVLPSGQIAPLQNQAGQYGSQCQYGVDAYGNCVQSPYGQATSSLGYTQVLTGPATAICPYGTDQYGRCMQVQSYGYQQQYQQPYYQQQQYQQPYYQQQYYQQQQYQQPYYQQQQYYQQPYYSQQYSPYGQAYAQVPSVESVQSDSSPDDMSLYL